MCIAEYIVQVCISLKLDEFVLQAVLAPKVFTFKITQKFTKDKGGSHYPPPPLQDLIEDSADKHHLRHKCIFIKRKFGAGVITGETHRAEGILPKGSNYGSWLGED